MVTNPQARTPDRSSSQTVMTSTTWWMVRVDGCGKTAMGRWCKITVPSRKSIALNSEHEQRLSRALRWAFIGAPVVLVGSLIAYILGPDRHEIAFTNLNAEISTSCTIRLRERQFKWPCAVSSGQTEETVFYAGVSDASYVFEVTTSSRVVQTVCGYSGDGTNRLQFTLSKGHLDCNQTYLARTGNAAPERVNPNETASSKVL